MFGDQYLRIGTYQGFVCERSPERSLKKVLEVLEVADKSHLDLLCFPETYLHGYLENIEDAAKYSIDLKSDKFEKLCQHFAPFQTTLLLGLNEQDEGRIYNTVVVIENGQCIGRYRKAYTYPPYDYFSCGTSFPVFEKKGIKYGIIVCLDSVYFEPARILALKGAQLLFCPMFNKIAKGTKMPSFMGSLSHLIARSFENNCWLVTSDAVAEEPDGSCAGHTCIISSHGQIMASAEPFQETLLTYSISVKSLAEKRDLRLLGKPELFEILQTEYQKRTERSKTC